MLLKTVPIEVISSTAKGWKGKYFQELWVPPTQQSSHEFQFEKKKFTKCLKISFNYIFMNSKKNIIAVNITKKQRGTSEHAIKNGFTVKIMYVGTKIELLGSLKGKGFF